MMMRGLVSLHNDSHRPDVCLETVSSGLIEKDFRGNVIWRAANSSSPRVSKLEGIARR